MFVSGVQESVLVDFISQNKVKLLHESKLVKIVFIKNFLTKTNKFIYFFKIYSQSSQTPLTDYFTLTGSSEGNLKQHTALQKLFLYDKCTTKI